MHDYLHRVYGIYETRHEAERINRELMAQGFAREQLELLDKTQPDRELLPDSDEVRNEVMADGAIGTVAGAGVGVLGEAALAAVNVSLFVASPVVGTLTMMGWGAMVGGLIGASIGAGSQQTRRFSDLVHDAIDSGYAVLIAYAESENQAAAAQAVIGDSVKAPRQVAS